MDKLFTPAEVADLLGCERHDLRNWRHLPADHPRHLTSTVVGCRHHYTAATIFDWLNRPENSNYREVVLASFCPPEIRQAMFPRARAAQIAAELRGIAPPQQEPNLSAWSTQ